MDTHKCLFFWFPFLHSCLAMVTSCTPRHPFIVLKAGKSKQTVSQSMVSNKRNGTIHGYTEENNNNNNISGYLFIQLMNMGSLSDII